MLLVFVKIVNIRSLSVDDLLQTAKHLSIDYKKAASQDVILR